MKYSYTTWVTVSIVAAIIVLAALGRFVQRRHAQPTPTPSVEASSSPTPTASSLTSPSPSSGASASPSATSSPAASASNADQAKAAYQKGDYTTAAAKYTLALNDVSAAKDKAIIYNLLANSYRDGKKTDQAIDAYRKAFAADPTLVTAYVNLSNVYQSQNKKDDAQAVLQSGLKANPNNQTLTQELSILNLQGTEGGR